MLRLHQITHELGRQLGILMSVADVYRLAINDRQGVAQFVAQITLVTDGAHGTDKISIVLIGIAPMHAVENIKTTDGSVFAALELTAEMRQNLQWADLACRLVNSHCAPVGHEGSVKANLQEG